MKQALNNPRSFKTEILVFTITLLMTSCQNKGVEVHAQLIFEEGFESGSYEGKWKTHLDGKTALVEIVTSPVRSGKYAAHMKTMLSGGDRRAELVPLTDHFNWREEYWVGFSILVKTPVEKAGIVHQHHSIPNHKRWKECGAGPNSLTIRAKRSNELLLLTATDDQKVSKKPETGAAVAYAEITPIEIDEGKWQDIVYHFRYAPDSSGYFQLWRNGELVFDDKGPSAYIFDNCGEPKFEQQYMKIGLYPALKGGDGEIFYDEIKIAGSDAKYKDVAPR